MHMSYMHLAGTGPVNHVITKGKEINMPSWGWVVLVVVVIVLLVVVF